MYKDAPSDGIQQRRTSQPQITASLHTVCTMRCTGLCPQARSASTKQHFQHTATYTIALAARYGYRTATGECNAKASTDEPGIATPVPILHECSKSTRMDKQLLRSPPSFLAPHEVRPLTIRC
jgi:hypothetical protein